MRAWCGRGVGEELVEWCVWEALGCMEAAADDVGGGGGDVEDNKSLFTCFHHVQRQRLHHLFQTSKFACAFPVSAASPHQK